MNYNFSLLANTTYPGSSQVVNMCPYLTGNCDVIGNGEKLNLSIVHQTRLKYNICLRNDLF